METRSPVQKPIPSTSTSASEPTPQSIDFLDDVVEVFGLAAEEGATQVLAASRHAQEEIISAQTELDKIAQEKAALGGDDMFAGWDLDF